MVSIGVFPVIQTLCGLKQYSNATRKDENFTLRYFEQENFAAICIIPVMLLHPLCILPRLLAVVGVFFLMPLLSLSPPAYASVVINEIYPKPSDETGEWIELYNSGPDSVTLDGWKIENSNGEKKTYQITGTTVPNGGFLRLNQSQTGIQLFNEGDSVHLYDTGNNQVDVQGFPSILGYNNSVGRSSDGGGAWTFCEVPTPNVPNKCPPPTLPPSPIPTESPVPTVTPLPTNTPVLTFTPVPTVSQQPVQSEVKGITYEPTPLPTISLADTAKEEERRSLGLALLLVAIGWSVLALIAFLHNKYRRRKQ